ncbi:MAG: PilT/PilU family type 4a pilus ATPase [Deltaproteobacteria bacterium]
MEKRSGNRIPLNLKVDFSLADVTDCPVRETTTNNLSAGGVLLVLNEPLPITTVLRVVIHSPRLLAPIITRCRVVWVKEIKQGQLYEIGTSFEQIGAKDLEFIKQWTKTVDLDGLLAAAVKKNASDIHLVGGHAPVARIYGELTAMPGRPLTAEEVRGLIHGLLTEEQRARFEEELELDISYANDTGRFRVNVFQEKGQLGAAFRYIPPEIKSFDELGLPHVLAELARKPKGLVLVTGPTGSGKSTTLAAMIELINREKKAVIMSLEEPIEFLYKSKRSIITQREIGIDSRSFTDALKYVVRQDVDVILIGEIRDLNSISVALTAAETGHLVLTTLHTIDTMTSLNRIIDVFPANQQQQVRYQLAETLQGVVSQMLLPRADAPGRAVATEVLVCTSAVANLIRRSKHEEIRNFLETGHQYGMHTMDKSLQDLYTKGMISRETVLTYAKELHKYL